MEQVEAALESLKYRHLEALQRRVRADIAEAERRGDLAQLAVFMAEKLKVDRQMRDGRRPLVPGAKPNQRFHMLIALSALRLALREKPNRRFLHLMKVGFSSEWLTDRSGWGVVLGAAEGAHSIP